MHHDIENYKRPDRGDTKLWRYMDFTKFICILEEQKLHLTRIDLFEDKFEGSYPKNNLELRKSYYGYRSSDGLSDVKPSLEMLGNMSHVYLQSRKCAYVSCWHMSDHESAAMWKLYSQSNEAIAIQTTYDRLINSLEQADQNFFSGIVNYVDYDTETIPEGNMATQFIYKRKSFEYEKEFRIIHFDPLYQMNNYNELGIKLDVDLMQLIDHIYISPLSPSWFYDLVCKILIRYKINKRVVYSNINGNPIY